MGARIEHSFLGLISLSGKRIKCAFTLEVLQDADGSILLLVYRMLSVKYKVAILQVWPDKTRKTCLDK